jgi:chromosome segregation ATPase
VVSGLRPRADQRLSIRARTIGGVTRKTYVEQLNELLSDKDQELQDQDAQIIKLKAMVEAGQAELDAADRVIAQLKARITTLECAMGRVS